ncbi:MAG: acyl-CoA dehydrogenase family protein [Acidimicrobiales bacterium]|jgi:acyl-CoA dehydrogenase
MATVEPIVKNNIRDRARFVAETYAGPASTEVDRDARFPIEAIQALRADGLLGVLIPPELGGPGVSMSEVADSVTELSRHCASTAMIYAMHQIQVACIVRHGHSEFFRDYMRDLVETQPLLASATTEAGIGGDTRTSGCFVDRDGDRFRLEKNAPVISYGQSADAILTTARRGPDSAPNDQVLVLCAPPGLTLEPKGEWDTFGFRGTCSLGFHLAAEGDVKNILTDTFDVISRRTMLPVAHVLWGSVWLGLASEAVDRSRAHVRSEARKKPGVTPPAAVRLAELVATLEQMRSLVKSAARRYDEVVEDPDALDAMGFALQMNALKISASTLVVDIVGRAMTICGMAGYREDSPLTLGRLLRDAHGAAVMVNNDRIIANNAQMLLVHKDR